MIERKSLFGAGEGERREIVLAGAGGQGLVFIGKLLGEAAVTAGLHAAQTQSYGVASRGGFTKSEIVLAGKPVACPHVMRPTAVLALTGEAYDRYAGRLDQGTTLVFDADACPEAASGGTGIALTTAARAQGMAAGYNLLALGAFLALTGVVPPPAVGDLLAERAENERGRANLEAFTAGLQLGEEARTDV